MRPSSVLSRAALLLAASLVPSLAAAQGQPPIAEDPRIYEAVANASVDRIKRDITTLVNFGTRHTMSDTLSKTRGIGAARRWIFAEFEKISKECGGCLQVRYIQAVSYTHSTLPTNKEV